MLEQFTQKVVVDHINIINAVVYFIHSNSEARKRRTLSSEWPTHQSTAMGKIAERVREKKIVDHKEVLSIFSNEQSRFRRHYFLEQLSLWFLKYVTNDFNIIWIWGIIWIWRLWGRQQFFAKVLSKRNGIGSHPFTETRETLRSE